MSSGPDGALYMGKSPVRRLFANPLGLSSARLCGGITMFVPQRLDVLMRDAARAVNAWENQAACPDSAGADVVQIEELIAQMRAASPQAVLDGDLGLLHRRRLERRLVRAEAELADAEASLGTGTALRRAARRLQGACRSLDR
jgi:hypothetical protein